MSSVDSNREWYYDPRDEYAMFLRRKSGLTHKAIGERLELSGAQIATILNRVMRREQLDREKRHR